MVQQSLSPAFQQALETEAWENIEELWLESLDRKPIPLDELLEVRRLLWKAGKKNLARTLLELLAETLETVENHEGALKALKELLRLTDKPQAALIERLLSSLRKARADKISLEAVLKKHPVIGSRNPFEEVEAAETWLGFDVGSAVEVRDQGVGKVVELNLELGNLKVDLGGKRPVSIPSGAIARFVRPLDKGSFLYRKVMEFDSLAEEVKKDPSGSLGHLLEGFEEPVPVATIKAALENLLPMSSWSSWWTKARKNPRITSSGSGSRLLYSISSSEEDAIDSLVGDLETLEPRAALKTAKTLIGRGQRAAERALDYLRRELAGARKTDPGLAWEIASLLRSISGAEEFAESTLIELVSEGDASALLAGIQDRGLRVECLERLRSLQPDRWQEIWAGWLLEEKTGSVLQMLAEGLDEAGYENLLDASLESIFRKHLQHPQQFIWACEHMVEETSPEALKRRMRPSLLEKLPDAFSRKEFAEVRSRAKALLEAGQVAVRIILETANPQQAQRFAQRVSRIDSVDPGQLRLVEQALRQCKGPESREELDPSLLFVASTQAIEAKRAELRNLLEKEIPITLKGIQAAAAEGDLRENAEYHQLRSKQELLSAKAAMIQEKLRQVLVLEPGKADTSRVNIGCVVEFECDEGDAPEALSILGAWDADLSKRIYANGTELAKKLFGCCVGDEVEVEGKKVRIAKISAW